MEIPIYQVDAFTAQPFKGNPAAVCLLDSTYSDEWMQKVATEMNLSETAFITKRDNGFSLRWFTPSVEVPLCGHATLASAHTLWETGTITKDEEAHFHTASGLLKARRAGHRIELDFPAIPSKPGELPKEAQEALGINPLTVFVTRGRGEEGYLIELNTEDEVRNARPDFPRLSKAISGGVIITAKSSTDKVDFVSRYFAVYAGIDEDPVTGAAHCALTPYWSPRLGKTEMVGYQASQRGGVVGVRLNGDRVSLFGEAVTILRGALLQ